MNALEPLLLELEPDEEAELSRGLGQQICSAPQVVVDSPFRLPQRHLDSAPGVQLLGLPEQEVDPEAEGSVRWRAPGRGMQLRHQARLHQLVHRGADSRRGDVEIGLEKRRLGPDRLPRGDVLPNHAQENLACSDRQISQRSDWFAHWRLLRRLAEA